MRPVEAKIRRDPLETHEREERYNDHLNPNDGKPGTDDVKSPGVNTILQPNLNNSLIGSVKLEAVKRLLAAPLSLTPNEWELLNLWFMFGQFDTAVHSEVKAAMLKVAKQLPAARKPPKNIVHRGFIFKQALFDKSMQAGMLRLEPRELSGWSLSQRIAGDYAKMALQEPGTVGLVIARTIKPSDVVMYADRSVLDALGFPKADDQKEVILNGNGVKALMPDMIDLVFVPKSKGFVSMDRYMQMRGIEE